MTTRRTQPEPDEKDRNFVTALARGLQILRAFRHGDTALSNTDFAERTGLPKPTISRLTHTLCQLGYLVQDQPGSAYRLGVGVLRLGFGVLGSTDICERAGEVLRELRVGANPYLTAALGEAHRAEVVYVAVSRSTQNVALTMHVGSRLPLFSSAMGRAILVGMTPGQRAAAVEAAQQDLGLQRDDLLRSIEMAQDEYVARGYCTGFSLWRDDVHAISVPVPSSDDGRVFGLNIGGPSFYVTPEELASEHAARLIDAAKQLSLRP
ncbi:transcriptional regulator, IclR family [Ruegeria lacuscaerulensis ITI-1157]|nr:transcriptional regulator, IclR family [Ruegeria lacuscaerulensis ITI-1157]SHK19326.1 transcriptional regulator, IclR family [Ruegeria lacuscaerulensis ITI-1157]